MNLLDDSDPGSYRENFIKQRRNLILLTNFLYIYYFVGITEISHDQSLLGLKFKLEHPEYIPAILAIIFFYFLLRYYQAWFLLGEQDPGEFKNKYRMKLIREYMNSQLPKSPEIKKHMQDDWTIEDSSVIEEGWINHEEGMVMKANANIHLKNSTGDKREVNEKNIGIIIPYDLDRKFTKTAFIKSGYKTNLFTEYYLPPALSFLLIALFCIKIVF